MDGLSSSPGDERRECTLRFPLVLSDSLCVQLQRDIRRCAHPNEFTAEHLRIASSLAISASVAIQNTRFYECAEIYASELARRSSSHQ